MLCRQFRVRKLSVFGSARGSDFQSGRSDIDLLVEFDEMPPAEHASAYFDLLKALERLFQEPIDLIEHSAVKNPYIRRAVDATQEILYAA